MSDNKTQLSPEEGQIGQINSMQYRADSVDLNTIQFRLNTEAVKKNFIIYLKGKMSYQYLDKDKKLVTEEVDLGAPKCNDEGYRSIMGFVDSIINSQTVQGNFKEEDLFRYLTRTRKGFIKDLFFNRTKYGIKISEWQGLVNTLFALVDPFMTRTTDDGERKSYSESMSVVDRIINNPKERGAKKGFLSGFLN